MAVESAQERWEVIFRGQVQGVGFRHTSRQIARRFQVTGFVRNEPDGTVRLVAEGAAGEIESFLGAIQNRMADYITDQYISRAPATGEFKGFDVRF